MAAAASDDVALAVDAPRRCATPAAATPRPEETAFDNSFFTAGCEKVAERSAHKSTFGLRQLMYAPDDRHDVAVLNIADLERLDERRDRIRHRGIERRCTWWCTLQGTVVTDVLRSPFFFASFGVYAATLWVFDKPEKEHNGLYATVLTVLGAFLSFASIFLNSETLVPVWKLTSVSGPPSSRHRVDGVEVDATILHERAVQFRFPYRYQRFRASYLASVKCQGCIFNATTCARASMRDVAARTVSRFICGAYIMAFAGLRDSHYDADEVLHPFLQKYGLLTEEEWEALRKRGGFAGTGDRYRELISWTLKVVNEERDAGRCHGHDAWRLCSDILMLRGKLAVGYDLLGQPVPFVYVHLVRLLTICYLPVFAFVLARLGSRLCGNQISGAPRHRRDVLSVAASARWRGDSTPSTRHCPCGHVGSTAWRLTKVHDNSLVDFHTGSRTPEAIGLACVAIVIACLFFLGINTVSTKLADPYGHDLDDLRILSHCKLMPGACKSILTAELPAGTRASLRVT